MESKNPRTCSTGTIKRLLRSFSVGQYNTSLYYEARSMHSSVCGGITTIVCALLLLYYAVLTMTTVLNRNNYYLDQTSLPLAVKKIIDINNWAHST